MAYDPNEWPKCDNNHFCPYMDDDGFCGGFKRCPDCGIEIAMCKFETHHCIAKEANK